MRFLLGAALVMGACSGGGSTQDSGVTADAGPQCTGVPARLTQYTCVGQGEPGSAAQRCESTYEATVAAHFVGNCDAGPGILGHVSVGECGEGLRAVRWVYGFPGDTYECVFPGDGGAVVGAINFSERGVFVSGQVGDCSTVAPSSCRDGG
jgi:hypothetical protein